MQHSSSVSFSIPHGDSLLILLTKDHHISYINEAACDLYQWQHHEVLGESLPKLLQNKNLPSPIPQDCSEIFEGNSLEGIETKHNDQEWEKWISWQILAYELHNTNDSMLLLGKDMTTVRQLEEELNTTRAKLKRANEKIFELDSIIAQAPGNLYWFSKDLVYLGCNENSAKVLNMSREDAVGQDFRGLMKKVVSPDDSIAETFVEHGMMVIKTGQPLLNIEEPPFNGPDGKMLHYVANKVPLRN